MQAPAPRFSKTLGFAPGLIAAMLIAAAASWAAGLGFAHRFGLSTLTLAIVFGIVIGNSGLIRSEAALADGVDFARTGLLRAGIVLYGLRIGFQDIATVGWSGVLLGATMVTLTFVTAVQLGTRVFRLDRETAMLVGAGSAVCGAAAVMAAAPVVRGSAHKVSVAVATVVVFGTIGMFAYPLLYPYLGLSEHAYGIFVGSTVHEVAQVVVAGAAVSEHAAEIAVVEKMLRVMMLAPFLLVLSHHVGRRDGVGPDGRRAPITIPWFALLFIAVSAIHSFGWVPAPAVADLVVLDTALLATAMAALGLRTSVSAVGRAGLRPIGLAATLFAFLALTGFLLSSLL